MTKILELQLHISPSSENSRLRKEFDRTVCCHPVCLTSCSIQGSNCCFLTHIQVSQETGKMVWYSHLFKSFPQFTMIHTVKDFGIVSETVIDGFLEFPCFLYDAANVGNLFSSSSALSKLSLDIWNLLVHIMLKTSMQDLKYELTSMGDEYTFLMVRTFFSTTLLGKWE